MMFLGNAFRVGSAEVTYGTLLALSLYLVTWFVLRNTVPGRHLYALGNNPEAARLMGLSSQRILLTVYSIAGLIYGIAALLLISRTGVGDPQAGQTDNLDSITAVVPGGTSLFGGRGSIVGTLLGALIVGVFRNGAAELVMGQGRGIRSFLYLFVGTFIGGGLVIDGRLHGGPHGNAGAVGSMPLALGNGHAARQLLHTASGFVLEQRFVAAGIPAAAAHDHRALSPDAWAVTERWLDEACPAIAMTIATSTALLDLEAVVMDGEIDRQLMREMIRRTQAALDRIEWEGMVRPQLIEGTIGPDARAMGGAILPLYAHFAPTHELFLKD